MLHIIPNQHSQSDEFKTRHFNTISATENTITKSSSDKIKMKNEHDFWYCLPDEMKNWFVQPYGFNETGLDASYSMKRLPNKDVAWHWLRGDLHGKKFERLLEKLFKFIDQRPSKKLLNGSVFKESDTIYVKKLEQRAALLLEMHEGERLQQKLRSETSFGSLEDIIQRYIQLYNKYPPYQDTVSVSHGDLCFSNILLDPDTGEIHLIDPRGGSHINDLYLHSYYDIAKLSHSVLGLYDYLNQEEYIFDKARRGLLPVPNLSRNHDAEQRLFVEFLQDRKIDPVTIRLCEASLFLSMLPLHRDKPDNVVAFALNAARMLDLIENGRAI